MQKYKFSVSLQANKHEVEVRIHAFNLLDAERKLRQMYPYGEITHSELVVEHENLSRSLGIAQALSLIAGEH